MVYVRSQRLRTGTYHYVIPSRHARPLPCGSGREAFEYAQELATEIRKAQRDARCGRIVPPACVWTLADAKAADLEEARRRGLRTAEAQFQGKISRRESHWNNLLAFFGEKTDLDEVTAAGIRAYVKQKERLGIGASAINKDLLVLKYALAIAAEREESGYHGHPFKAHRKLKEIPKRAPIAVSGSELDQVVRACRKKSRRLGAHVEMLRLTACRLHEFPSIEGDFLRFPPHKRGRAGSFRLEGRLAVVARERRAFSYRLWYAAIRKLPHPRLRPHDIRHSVLTILGKQPGMTLDELLKWGRWKDVQMANRYLHPDDSALPPADRLQQYAQQRRKSVPRRTVA